MVNFAKFLTNTCLSAGLVFAVAACSDTDEFFNKGDNTNVTNSNANVFDFSTKQEVDLIVDYSAFNTNVPVEFSIYSSDPFVKDNEENPYYLDENIAPIFSDYTDAAGKYDKTVTLPAYAKVLYIVTGDIKVYDRRMVVEVANGKVKAVAKKTEVAATRGVRLHAKGEGVPTRDLTNMYNLWMEVDDNGKSTGKQIYKEWRTVLGQWNTCSGRPYYLMDHSAENIGKGLVFTDDVLNGLFTTARSVLKSTSTCAEVYRTAADLTLTEDSEVSITMLGGNTCWCSSLGYYFYNDKDKPTNPMDIDIIMLFPNTMDELYEDKPTCDMNGNIGARDGDVIQLKYYPKLKENNYAGGTTIFPKGTKIGFIMKTNGWGSRPGQDYSLVGGTGGINWNCARKYNNWPTSTDGLSYSTALKDTGSKLIKNGKARTAKFAYVAPDKKEYAIVAFEDACNDENYSDVIFAVNPANVFATLPKVGLNSATTTGVFAYEDLWPNRGDYDMNDVVINVQDEKSFNSSGKVVKQTFSMTTYQKNVELINGLACRLNTNATPSTVTMKRMAPGVTDVTKATTASFAKYRDSNTGKDVYYLTSRVEDDLGSTYILELTYSNAQDATKLAEVEPFIYRPEGDGTQWEVHIPMTKPTSKMNSKYFGTCDDRSEPSAGKYFVREGLYPFAFYLSGTNAEKFFDTILGKAAANKPINEFYPTFLPWSESQGKTNEDWYIKPRK